MADTSPTSRRALLAGAIGGIGALAAAAMGRPERATAGVVPPVSLGIDNASTSATSITTSTQSVVAFAGISATGSGVLGQSTSLYGVHGHSSSGAGVFGDSTAGGMGVYGSADSNHGIFGFTSSSLSAGVVAHNAGDGTGLLGFSGNASPPAGTAKTGVYGRAEQDNTAKAIHGQSSIGYAGYFSGKVYLSSFQEMREMSAPSAPGTNKGRLFMRANASGKTQLCVRFNTGAIQVIATQP